MFYIKFDFKNKKDRWAFLLLSAATAIFLGLMASGTLKATTYPFFCVTCHEMNPEYQTWKVSSHSSLSCSVCHMESGIAGLWEYEKELVKRVQKHFNGDYYKPITMTKTIPQERCLKCHSSHRKATPRGDIIIPHDKHAARQITCVECHSGVAHGNIASRGLTEDIDYSLWTPVMAKAEMGHRNTGLSMQGCVECHESLEVRTSCEDCHGVIRKPSTHLQQEFTTNHGQSAQEDLKECNACHSYSKSYISIETPDNLNEVAIYARENSFCTDCHQKRPAGHTLDWRNIHGKIVGEMSNRSGCLVCHDENPRSKTSKGVEPSCNSCHGEKHTDSWRGSHPDRVTRLEFTSECFKCHPTPVCGKCHYTKVK